MKKYVLDVKLIKDIVGFRFCNEISSLKLNYFSFFLR